VRRPGGNNAKLGGTIVPALSLASLLFKALWKLDEDEEETYFRGQYEALAKKHKHAISFLAEWEHPDHGAFFEVLPLDVETLRKWLDDGRFQKPKFASPTATPEAAEEVRRRLAMVAPRQSRAFRLQESGRLSKSQLSDPLFKSVDSLLGGHSLLASPATSSQHKPKRLCDPWSSS
jgi:hypothetical protein